MTPQEIFNTVRTHLLTQGCHSRAGGGGCRYRGDEGTKCAIGCLIPDYMYDSGFEGWSVGPLVSTHPRMAELFGPEPPLLLLDRLQAVHDENPVDEWEDRLERVAVEFGLCVERTEA
jgi:hypothetical protein